MRPARTLVRLLLLLFPGPFRRRYGTEMEELFLWRLDRRSSKGRLATLATGAGLTREMVTEGIKERLVHRRWIGNDDSTWREREGMMKAMWRDATDAVRRIVRAPLFGLVTVGILALGLGANIAVFTLVNAVLFRPPPYEDPERVVSIYQDSDDGEPSSSSFPATRDMARYDDIFSGVAATSRGPASWETEAGPRPARVEYTTASTFPVLGLTPGLGRWFEPRHDRVGEEMVAVVSHRTWRTRMGADPDVLGRTVRLNGQPITVIGVGPEGFNGMDPVVVTDFWLSLSSTPVGGSFRVANLDRRQDHWYDVKARLAPGVTVERAQAAMDALAADLAERFPELNRNRGITVFPAGDVRIHPEVDRMAYPVAGALMAVAGLVLVLVLSNLANLLLVRGISRGPEMAVRRALGAGRTRIARLFVLEALLLAGVGGTAGLFLARRAIDLVPLDVLTGNTAALDFGMDLRVVGFAALLTLATGVFFGLAPALRSMRTDVSQALREGRSRTPTGRRVPFFRNVLVGVQVAVSVVLLVGAILLVRSLANLQEVDVGVDAERVAYAATSVRQAGLSAPEGTAMIEDVRERMRGLPGVQEVALATRLPVQRGSSSTTVVEGYAPPSGTGAVELPMAFVSEGYFEVMGIPLLAGRTFDPGDRTRPQPVVVVNETFARRFWGDLDPTGRRLRPQSAPDAWREIVGVVGDIRVSSLQEPPRPMMYLLGQQWSVTAYLLARTSGDPAGLASGLRTELEGTAPGLPLTDLGTLEEHLSDAMAIPRLTTRLLGVFALLALLLASLGIYAVVSFSVARRTAEVGIRIALGAGRGRVVGMVVREVLVTVVLALLLGGALSALSSPLVEGALYGVGGVDALSLSGAALLFVSAAGAAAYVPARRAAGADPLEALRAE